MPLLWQEEFTEIPDVRWRKTKSLNDYEDKTAYYITADDIDDVIDFISWKISTEHTSDSHEWAEFQAHVKGYEVDMDLLRAHAVKATVSVRGLDL